MPSVSGSASIVVCMCMQATAPCCSPCPSVVSDLGVQSMKRNQTKDISKTYGLCRVPWRTANL